MLGLVVKILWKIYKTPLILFHAARLKTQFTGVRAAIDLTDHNWQKWKRVFLTCPFYEIFKDEAVQLVLKVANVLEKLQFMWICGIWGNFVKI